MNSRRAYGLLAALLLCGCSAGAPEPAGLPTSPAVATVALSPTAAPTLTPTTAPTLTPTVDPTATPTASPTTTPTCSPSSPSSSWSW